MSAQSLESIQKNITEVYRAQLTGGNCFLDKELNVIDDSSQRAKLETIILFMQEQHWNYSDNDNFKSAKAITFGLRNIYQDDPQAKCFCDLFEQSVLAYQQPKTLETYAGRLQKQLSTLVDLRMRLTLLSLHQGMVDGQFYFEAMRQFESEVQSSISEVSDTPENQRLAFQCLLLIEGVKRAASMIPESAFSGLDSQMQTLLSLFDTANPELSEFRRDFFPSIQTYCDGLGHENSREVSVFRKYEGKCQVLGKIKEESKRSESIYTFLKNELRRIRDSYKGKKKFDFLKKYCSNISVGFVKQEPFMDSEKYCSMSVDKYLPQLNMFHHLHLQLQDLISKFRSAKESTTKSKEVVISSQVPDWKEAIGVSRGLDKPFEYAERVTRWYDTPGEALQEDKYVKLPQPVKEKVTFFHAFPTVIDQFVGTNYCFEEEDQQSPGVKLYAIPAEVHMEGQVYRGFFQYAIADEVCFHHCFGEKTDRFSNAIRMGQVWEPSDYPTLEESKKIKQSKPKEIALADTSVYVEPVFGTIEIKTPEARVYLYKARDN